MNTYQVRTYKFNNIMMIGYQIITQRFLPKSFVVISRKLASFKFTSGQ